MSGAPEPGLAHAASSGATAARILCSVAACLTVAAVFLDTLTLASSEYGSVLVLAIVCAGVALVLALGSWRRAGLAGRLAVIVLALADVAVIVDAVQREISTAQAISAAREARLEHLRRADPWSNSPAWCADVSGRVVRTRTGECRTRVVELGELTLPTGKIALCDPGYLERASGVSVARVPPGRYAVSATLADFSAAFAGGDERVAYASLRIAHGAEVYRAPVEVTSPEHMSFAITSSAGVRHLVFYGATIALVDDEALATCLPPRERWADEAFGVANAPEAERRRADPTNALRGVVNVPLPFAEHGENAVLFRGTGAASVVGGYDAASRLVALHLDFGVVR